MPADSKQTSDGEDRPSDVAELLAHFCENPDRIHVAERGKRSESAVFRTFYLFYKIAFYLGTGMKLAHGNFCLLPKPSLVGILHRPDAWNNFAASIVRSKMPYCAHKMTRGRRYEGKSKMGFTSLLLHGLSAISVHLDVITARTLIASAFSFAILIAMLFVVIGIRISRRSLQLIHQSLMRFTAISARLLAILRRSFMLTGCKEIWLI
jgi:hypothetical protein